MEQFFTVLFNGVFGFIGIVLALAISAVGAMALGVVSLIASKHLLRQMDAEYKATREQARKVVGKPVLMKRKEAAK